MSNMSSDFAGLTEALPAFGSTTVGVAVTASGSANTKGSYSNIGTTTFDWDEFLLFIIYNGSSTRFRVDIAISDGGSDRIICEDLYVEWFLGAGTSSVWRIPIRVPSGAVIDARCQSTTGSSSVRVALLGMQYGLMPGGHPAASKLMSATDYTNTDVTNTLTFNGTTMTGWTQIMASTPEDFIGLLATISCKNDTTRASQPDAVEIGVGGAGSEKVIGRILYRDSETIPGPSHFWADIPAASRLAIRGVSGGANANSAALALFGLKP